MKRINYKKFGPILFSFAFACTLIVAASAANHYANAQTELNGQYTSYSDYPGHYVCYICPTPPPPPPPTCIADGDASYQIQCNRNATECCSGVSDNGVCGDDQCAIQ